MNDSEMYRANINPSTLYTKKILGEDVDVHPMKMNIYELQFLPDNPRVYSCTHGDPEFANKTEDEQQKFIFEKLCEQNSVQKLKKSIREHQGLLENILVRYDKMQVVEGNSRLAVYRLFDKEFPDDGWGEIQCDVVSSLSEEQQAAYLSQIHVIGKKNWTAYERAHYVYRFWDSGWRQKQIADVLTLSPSTVSNDINIIESMRENNDKNQSHFSFYKVMLKQNDIRNALQENDDLKNCLTEKIRNFGKPGIDEEFSAQQLRDQLPAVLKKPKLLQKFINGKSSLEECSHLAEISAVQKKMKSARETLDDITFLDIKALDNGEVYPVRYEVKKLEKGVKKLSNMLEEHARAFK